MHKRVYLQYLLIFGVAAGLTDCTADPQNHSSREEIRDGVKIIHNFKDSNGTKLKDLSLREDLVIGGETEVEDYILVRPVDIAADAAGNIFVLDSRNCTVKKYGPDGVFLARIGRWGQGPGEFEMPGKMCLDKAGYLYVRDLNADKIEIFNNQGTPQRSIKGIRWLNFTAAPGEEFVFEYSEIIGEGSAAKRVLRIAAGDANKARVVFYSRDQLPLRAIQNKDFRFEIPLYVRWDIAPDGRIYIGTANRYEIQVMKLDGRVSFAFTKDFDPIPVPISIRSAALKQISVTRLPARPINARDFEEYLQYYPIFKSITSDEQGRIWVSLLRPENPDQPTTFSVFDVFSSEGVFLFTTKIEGDLAIRPFFLNGNLYALRRDAKGYIQAVRYRLPRVQ